MFHTHTLIPVITLTDANHALPLADALAAGGITILEITLRTPAGLAAIEQLRKQRPTLTIGAGTITTEARLQQAVEAGAQFLVSPGFTPRLAKAVHSAALPWLPGVATVSETMQASDVGFDQLKFFPAAISGGVGWLKSLASVLPELSFCPTGGIDAAAAKEYLALPNVFAVGGSWFTPPALLDAQDWEGITALAQRSLQTCR
jgi:2-dehydro-3-deoxyphosphogluconate aldolase/(4S)-4-hydroxy-2-oxoglutarate aldolase